jgi:hypothetical protein
MILRTFMTLAILLCGTRIAWATGNLECEADDRMMEFFASSSVSYGETKPITNFKARLQFKRKDMPETARILELDGSHLVHHWIDDRDVKLLFHREKIEDMSVEVTLRVETRRKPGDELRGTGHYEMTLSFPAREGGSQPRIVKHRGQVRCSVG